MVTMARRPRRGFTLIELMVVMAIIGTLLALKQDLAVMREAIGQFHGDLGRYPDNLNELVAKRYLKRIPVDPITERSDTWLAVAHPDPNVTGMYDITSGAEGVGRDGSPYQAW